MRQTLSLVLLSVLMAGCSKFQSPVTKRTQMTLLSAKQEIEIGEKEYRSIIKKCIISDDEEKLAAIKRISDRLVKEIPHHKFNWEFQLIDNDNINAVCLPGGKIIINTGIFKVAKNDDQIAAVIAHEIAHALSRHGNARISRAKVVNGIHGAGAIALGVVNPFLVVPFVITYSGLTKELVLDPKSRVEEHEADVIGLNLMHKAGYDIYQTLDLWENMKKANPHKAVSKNDTHGSYEDRITSIKRAIQEIKLKKEIQI